LLPIGLTWIAQPGVPRAKMARRTVTWEDRDETVRTAQARFDDIVPFRRLFSVAVPIRSGTKVLASWCWDDCSGMNKWCREDDGITLGDEAGADRQPEVNQNRGHGA